MKLAVSFLVQSHQELQKKKKNHPKKYTPRNYYSKEQSIKHEPSKNMHINLPTEDW